jgi:ABC-2 type transport system permease protein
VVAVGVSVLVGVCTTLALIGVGLPAAGSVAFGLSWAGVGIAFAAVAALAAQVTRSARTATGLAVAVLAVVYVLRAVGDTASATGPTWLSWLSPIGWAQQLRPYAGDRWWLSAITIGFAILVTAAAVALAARRDLNAGLMADRPGPAHAPSLLRGPLGLAWRLQRGVLLAWTGAFLLGGLIVGGIAANIGGFVAGPQARQLITELGGQQGLTNAFLAAELGMLGVIVSAYGIQAALRLRTEEIAGHVEPVLATGTGRGRWMVSHIVVALAGSAVMLAGAGLTAGLTRAADTGRLADAWGVLGGALVQIPAAWVLIGIVVAVFGSAPRLVTAGWAALVLFLLLGELGPLLRLRQWVMDLSPFTDVPRLPGVPVTATPLVWLFLITGLLVTAGLAGFRRRDVG